MEPYRIVPQSRSYSLMVSYERGLKNPTGDLFGSPVGSESVPGKAYSYSVPPLRVRYFAETDFRMTRPMVGSSLSFRGRMTIPSLMCFP